jgi:hypothetical protein
MGASEADPLRRTFRILFIANPGFGKISRAANPLVKLYHRIRIPGFRLPYIAATRDERIPRKAPSLRTSSAAKERGGADGGR